MFINTTGIRTLNTSLKSPKIANKSTNPNGNKFNLGRILQEKNISVANVTYVSVSYNWVCVGFKLWNTVNFVYDVAMPRHLKFQLLTFHTVPYLPLPSSNWALGTSLLPPLPLHKGRTHWLHYFTFWEKALARLTSVKMGKHF